MLKYVITAIFAIALTLSLTPDIKAESGGHGDGHGDAASVDHGPNWTYTGQEGPSHWGDLGHDYITCKKGRNQSPVNIGSTYAADLEAIEFHYMASGMKIVNNGHTIQLDYDKGSYIKLAGTKYHLAQFHFHGPSEHTVGGKHFPIEMHLVHKSDKGALAVIGVMVKEGKHNSNFDNVWVLLPSEKGPAKDYGVLIKARYLLPASKAYTTYTGSLTTPPCTEGVTWLLMNEPVEMSAQQIETYRAIYHGNNRPVQPLHGRTLKSVSK